MKKLVLLILIVALCAMIITGCTSDSSSTAASTATDATATTGTTAASTATDATATTGTTGDGSPTPVSAFVNYIAGVEDLSTNYATKAIEEKFNVKITWDGALRGGDCNEKFNILINSGGKLPDVIIAHEAVSNTAKWQYGEQGLFIPLNDLIEKYGKNQKKLWDMDSAMKDMMTSPDGKIYSLGNYAKILHAQYWDDMWINQAWLDNLGLQMPETTDDLVKVLDAFITKDPNGNGKNDELGIVGNAEWWGQYMFGYLTNPFVYSGNWAPYSISGGKIDTFATKPEYKEALKYMNMLWSKGYIDNLSITQNGDQVRQTVMGDAVTAGIIAAYSPMQFAPMNSEQGNQYTMLKPVKGPNGLQNATYSPAVWGNNTFIITKDCANPDLVYQIGDFLLSDEGALLTYYGEKGVDWEPAHDGDIGIDGKPASIRQLVELYNQQSQNKAWMSMGLQVDIRFIDGAWVNPDDKFNESVRLYSQTNEKEVPYTPKDGYIPPLTLTSDESEQSGAISTEVDKYFKEMRAKFISGEVDIDTGWDEYVKNLESLQIADQIKIMQTAYDRQYKK